MSLTQIMKNLDEGKYYSRTISVNGKKYKNKEFSESDTGFYINGLEFFKRGQYYWLKTYTSWGGKVYINNIFKINSEGNLIKFYLNTFGLSQGRCVLWENNDEAKEELNEWVGLINEYVDSDDEDRKVILKDNPVFK